ncbi:MAG: B12-binding domain-containing radical SAM protein [Candidatus Omnitrophica bacterium]|nr:B12-binding domain-containing radical SAM protein [Candidatus Omnitrophota bacterium]
MSKKVILFNPITLLITERDEKSWIQRRGNAPLGLLSLAGPLIANNYDVTIIDQSSEANWQERLIAGLKENPICVGLCVTTGIQIAHALAVSKLIKNSSASPVVWGGNHPTALPEQTVCHPCVDIVVIGEGETTLVELVQALEQKSSLADIKGLCYKNGGKIMRTLPRELSDITQQPPLPYHLLKNGHGFQLKFITSRGCPFECRFCYNARVNGRRWRAMTAPDVLKMVDALFNEYGHKTKMIRFVDDNFFADIERAKTIVQGITKYNIPWHASVRIDTFLKADDDFMNTLDKSHLRYLHMGLESGSPRMLAFINKRLNPAEVIAVNKRFSHYSFRVTYHFILGIPTETIEDIKETMSLIHTLLKDNPHARKNLNVFTPYPNNDLFDIAVSHGFKPPQTLEEWSTFNFKNTVHRPWLTPERKTLIEMIIFCSIFLEKNRFPKASLIYFLALIYRPIALLRLKHLYAGVPIEIAIARCLGFTG